MKKKYSPTTPEQDLIAKRREEEAKAAAERFEKFMELPADEKKGGLLNERGIIKKNLEINDTRINRVIELLKSIEKELDKYAASGALDTWSVKSFMIQLNNLETYTSFMKTGENGDSIMESLPKDIVLEMVHDILMHEQNGRPLTADNLPPKVRAPLTDLLSRIRSFRK